MFYDYNSTPCNGNIVGNHTVDTMGTKWLGNVVTLSGAADDNILTNNSAKGPRSGAQAAQTAGTGTNNVIANNVNA